jgi:hypothetical protein
MAPHWLFVCAPNSELVRLSRTSIAEEMREEHRRRRAAKGLKGEVKTRGHPLGIAQGLRTLHAEFVEQGTEHGETVRQSAREFLEIMRIGEKKAKSLAKLISPTAICAHWFGFAIR